MKRTMKLFSVMLIILLTLPFYCGKTSSYSRNKENNPDAGRDSRLKPPAKVAYENTDVEESMTPVKVIPVPESSETDSETNPVDSPDVLPPSPSPDENSDNDNGDNGDMQPAHQPGSPEQSGEEEHKDEIPVNSGMLLQDLLNDIYHYEEDKVAYLTFDDGPTPHLTDRILDILKQENVKATFFPIGYNAEDYPDLIKRVYEEGHGMGNHTYSHVFKQIYSKPENLVDEFTKTEEILQSILGEDKNFKLVRFPGGSFGNKLKPFREAVNKAGFGYIDWNSLNGDAESVKPKPVNKLIARFKETYKNQCGLIVLMHDAPGKKTTPEALPEIIKFLKGKGYRFELLPGSR